MSRYEGDFKVSNAAIERRLRNEACGIRARFYPWRFFTTGPAGVLHLDRGTLRVGGHRPPVHPPNCAILVKRG